MEALCDELPWRTIGQRRHCDQLLVGRVCWSDDGGFLRALCRVQTGGSGNFLCCNPFLWFKGFCFRWRYEAEVFHSELVMGEHIAYGCLGFFTEGRVVPGVFMGALIKNQYSGKKRIWIDRNRPA